MKCSPLSLCRHIYEDPVSHNVTLLGIFTTLRATRFPTPYQVLYVYTLLDGVSGEMGEIHLRCVSDATRELVTEETRRTQMGPFGKRHVSICMDEFRFPQAGAYNSLLSFNDETIGEHVIFVTEE